MCRLLFVKLIVIKILISCDFLVIGIIHSLFEDANFFDNLLASYFDNGIIIFFIFLILNISEEKKFCEIDILQKSFVLYLEF